MSMMEQRMVARLRAHPRLWIAARTTRGAIQRPVHMMKRVQQRRAVVRYLTTHENPKIFLGAGPARHEGWLSTDVAPVGDAVYLDVTRRFPIPDAVVARYHCEHMVEHIGWYAALDMAKEMHRTLRPGGIARIATPDLGRIAALLEARDERAQTYVDEANRVWATQPDARVNDSMPVPYRNRPAFVLNRLFYGWGHRFVFDRETLADLLEIAGFARLRWCTVGQSDDPELCGLESHGTRIAETINAFETMVVEAVKSGPGT